MSTITYIQTGTELISQLSFGKLHPPIEARSLQRALEFFQTEESQAIVTKSSVQSRTFSLRFSVGGDTTGTEQILIEQFFMKNGTYRITDSLVGLSNFDFSVMSIDVGADEILITCLAAWGKTPTIFSSVLSSQEMEGGEASSAVSTTFTNSWGYPASFRLTLKAAAETAWDPESSNRIETSEGGMSFSTTKLSRTGSPEIWRGTEFVIDTYREIQSGFGIISPAALTFVQISPGVSGVTVELAAMDSPLISGSVEWTLKLEAIAYGGTE